MSARSPARLPSLACCALLCGCLTPARRPPGPGPAEEGAGLTGWVEVESPHLRLRAATSEADARAAALKLERLREALLLSTWHSAREPLARIEVLLLPRKSTLRDRFGFPASLQGASFIGVSGQLRLVATAEQDQGAVPVFKHELAHAISRGYLLREPLWLGEGHACWAETLALGEGRATLGGLNQERLADALRAPLPLLRLLSYGPELYQERDELVQVGFYGRAWLFFDLLVSRHRPQLEALLSRLARAEEPQAAFAASFPGLTLEELERELQAHARSRLDPEVSQVLPPPSEVALVVRPLTEAQVRLAHAQLWQVASSLQPAAKEHAEAAARLALLADPTDPEAIETWQELAAPSAEESALAARKATLGRPQDARGWILLAEALGHSAGPERERAVEEAVRLAPGDARALLALAQLRLLQERIPEALAAAQAANRERPGRPGPIDAMASALAGSGRCAEAMQAELRVLEVLPERAPAPLVEGVRARLRDLGERCQALLEVREEVREPQRISCPQPVPKLAPWGPRQRSFAKVTLDLRADGSIAAARSAAGVPAKVAQALEAYVQTCRYRPATRGGLPVASQLDEEFTFWKQR
jgi:tetratricopeptide (TPR) repeat protein